MTDIYIGNSILLFFAQGAHFFLTALLAIKLLRQYNNRIKLHLSLLLIFWVLLHVKDLIIYHSVESISQQQLNWITMIDQLTVPLCAIFLFKMIGFRYINILGSILILPCLILTILYIITPYSIILTLSLSLSGIYSVFTVAYITGICYKTPRTLPNRRALFLILNSFVVIAGSWLLSCIKESSALDILYYIVSGLAWGVIYYTIEHIYSEERLTKELNHDANKTNHEYPFAYKLNHLINDEQIFLNPELSLSDVARLIGTNRSYLSEYFNNNCHSSFIDYINSLRINYAEELMIQNEKMSLDEISSSSGFNSLSTFRRAFIKKHGITPSNYRHEHLCSAK